MANYIPTMTKLKQTSKTILFEEFNSSPEAVALDTILVNEDVHNKDEFLKMIKDKLEVKSFEDFETRFLPDIWEWTILENDLPKFCYSVGKKPQNADIIGANKIKLVDHAFYKMVMNLYNTKRVSGKDNIEFDYSRISELLSPRKIEEETDQIRRNLSYNRKKMLELDPKQQVELKECKGKILEARKDIARLYAKNPSNIFKLALVDTQKKLKAFGKDITDENGEVTEQKLLPCKFSLDIDGSLKVDVINVEDESERLLLGAGDDEDRQKYMQLIGNDYNKHGGELVLKENPETPTYMKNLLLSVFFDEGTAVEVSKAQLLENRNHYFKIYQSSQQEFAKAVTSIIEKVLNVRVFFDNAVADGKLHSSLIVSNCKVDRILDNDKIKKIFTQYINEISGEIEDKKIWFAIIPAIGDVDFSDFIGGNQEVDDEFDLFGDDTSGGKDKVKNGIYDAFGEYLTSQNNLNEMVSILKKAKITTFFNYKANEKTGFTKFSKSIIEQYNNKTIGIEDKNYAVCCFPNFTILPRKQTTVEIGSVFEDGAEYIEYITLLGVYIDSSYLAAGLVVGTQNPFLLREKGYNVNLDNVCVRYDIEEGENKFIMKTTLNREGASKWSYDVEDYVADNSFGFVFCGNTEYYNNNLVNNSYVYMARRLDKNPIYCNLVSDFVIKYLDKRRVSRVDAEDFMEVCNNWRKESKSKTLINNILREGESIDYKIEDGKANLNIKFNNVGTPVPVDVKFENESEE